MHAPSSRTRKIAAFTVGPAAILVAGLLVWQGSVAAFTAQTANVGNNWSTGSVTLSNDSAGVAAFQVQNVTPGQTGTRCLKVTSTSTVPGTVKTYIARLGAQGLENNILVSTQIGTGGSFADCTGFVSTAGLPSVSLSTAAVTYSNYSTGVLPWSTTGTAGESMTYKVTWIFDTTGLSQSAIDALQGKSVSVDVVWELQSN
ncbi:MAG: hypothetical protein V4479_06995 [Actinomycetota bacterium]